MPNDGRGRSSKKCHRVFILKLLLTGSGGFTGKHFAFEAKKAGHEVVALMADLTDPIALRAELLVCGPIDAVVHLAAISFVGHADDSAFYAVNTVGTTHLLTALAHLPAEMLPRKVLVASSANVYGNCETSPINEAQLPAPVNHYAASKLAMEHMTRIFSDRLPIVIARPFNYTGPGQALSFLIPKIVSHFAKRAHRIELGNLHVEREFNDVEWVCSTYLKLIETGKPGSTYNVCSGVPYSIQSVIDQLTNLTGHIIHVDMNPALVRHNEVHRLCGDPTMLIDCTGEVNSCSLSDTLSKMLKNHAEY